ncbi:hypothetical protein DM02DRAFT_262596 [Periconia macrospinosa]|uniref:Uncharacterized protein n=1 Tax=Periconia macrospinosa TaxID=97972 RepID=A0A2V1D6I2_9PLEO|nr:hypothetical protein DM02DRAFT_262596 [Periconia macrospinosa]
MEPSPKQIASRRVWIGHGILMIVSGLIGGFLASFFIVGGVEIWPGHIIELSFPGTEKGWLAAHTGPIMNGLMVILLAIGITYLDRADADVLWTGWVVTASGWANVGFYFFANFTPNRGTSFGANRIGGANIFSTLALGPPAVTNPVAVWSLSRLGYAAIVNGKKRKQSQE